MSRDIFKKTVVEGFFRLKPGEWCLDRPMINGKLSPYICVPGPHFGCLRAHDISANGEVNPSVKISYGDKEVYHKWITLEGWEG